LYSQVNDVSFARFGSKMMLSQPRFPSQDLQQSLVKKAN